MSYLNQETDFKILQESGFGILLEQNLVTSTLSETITLTDTLNRGVSRALTQTITLTDTITSGINAIWEHIAKSAAGTWTKVTKSNP